MSLRNYGSYALFSVLVFLVTCGFLFPLFAPVDDVVGELSTETKATESPLERCDVVIVGAGVGGLYTAFHLSAKLGDRLCLIDDRERAGGKVQSYPIKGTDVLAPTCAEQMRDIDVQLRCLCRDLNVSVWVRGEVSLYFHNYTQFSGPNQFETTDGGFRICLSCFFLLEFFIEQQTTRAQSTWSRMVLSKCYSRCFKRLANGECVFGKRSALSTLKITEEVWRFWRV